MRIEKNRVVTLNYTLRDEQGTHGARRDPGEDEGLVAPVPVDEPPARERAGQRAEHHRRRHEAGDGGRLELRVLQVQGEEHADGLDQRARADETVAAGYSGW